MIAAFNPSDPELSYHHKNHFQFEVVVDETGSQIGKPGSLDKDNKWLLKVHGIIMWILWTFFSLIMIGTNRYLRHKWIWRQKLHTISGICLTILTMVGSVFSLDYVGW